MPEALEAVVLRCLQRHPARRYQTTAELLSALNRLDDKGKKLPAIRRLTPRMVAATAAVGLVLLAATFYVTRIFTTPPVQPDPVSVVIADLENRTGDPAFDRTLEPMLRRALEGAGFISAYDRNGISPHARRAAARSSSTKWRRASSRVQAGSRRGPVRVRSTVTATATASRSKRPTR